MKLKNMVAGIAACAIAVSGLAVTASAKITNATESNGSYKLDIKLPEGRTFADIYGFEATFEGTVQAEGESNVGAICWQSTSVNWTQEEFSQKGASDPKPITISDDNTVKVLKSEPLFASSDEYAQAFVAQWTWDDDKQIDFSVTSLKVLDKDGNELGAAETTAAATTTTKAATTTTKAGATTKAGTTTAASSKTGDAGVGVAVAGLSLAAVAAFAARKKH